MGMYAVDFDFQCVDDNGNDLSGITSAQEMDAFIGYGGHGDSPPSLIRIGADRSVTCAFTGKTYDPKAAGHEDNDAYPQVYEGEHRSHMVGVRVVDGRAVQVVLMDPDCEDDLPEWEQVEVS